MQGSQDVWPWQHPLAGTGSIVPLAPELNPPQYQKLFKSPILEHTITRPLRPAECGLVYLL